MRPMRPMGGLTERGIINTDQSVISNISGSSSAVSPYLLFPDDEIVIGVDAGLTNPFTGSGIQAGGFNELTGSMMTITAGGAKLTLFGSLVRNKQEFHNNLNQELTSDAIHEAISYDIPVTDQSLVENRESYIGTYMDRLMTGKVSKSVYDQRRSACSFV